MAMYFGDNGDDVYPEADHWIGRAHSERQLRNSRLLQTAVEQVTADDQNIWWEDRQGNKVYKLNQIMFEEERPWQPGDPNYVGRHGPWGTETGYVDNWEPPLIDWIRSDIVVVPAVPKLDADPFVLETAAREDLRHIRMHGEARSDWRNYDAEIGQYIPNNIWQSQILDEIDGNPVTQWNRAIGGVRQVNPQGFDGDPDLLQAYSVRGDWQNEAFNTNGITRWIDWDKIILTAEQPRDDAGGANILL